MHEKHKRDPRRLKTNGIVVSKDERNEQYPGIWLHGRKFQCKLTDPEKPGKQKTKTIPKEHQGSWKKAHDWFKHESTKDESERLIRCTKTLIEYANDAIDKRLSGTPSSKAAYRKRMKTWPKPLHSKLVSEIDNRMVLDKILQPMKDAGLAGSTINGVLHILRTIFDLAVSDQFLDSNPIEGIARADKVSRKTQIKHVMLNEREARLYIEGLLPHYRPLVALAYFAGLRLGEALGLTFKHIDWNRMKIVVAQQRTAESTLSSTLKSEASYREIDLSAPLIPYLKELEREARRRPVASLNLDDELLLPDLNHRAAQDYLLGYGRRLGYLSEDNSKLHLSAHSFRHMWVSGLILDGINAITVAAQAGHTPSSLWEHYAREIKQAQGRNEIREALEARHA